jgi:hypothetical protein
MGDVQALVALEPDEIGVEGCGSRRSKRCLADAGLPFEKERLPETKSEKERYRQPAVGHVVVGGEPLLEFGDGSGRDRRDL